MAADAFDYDIARRFFGVSGPGELAELVRSEAPQTLQRALGRAPNQENCFRIWLACFAFRIEIAPRELLQDARYIARAEALIAVRRDAEARRAD